MKKVALISGITGQDGSFLAELLIEKGYEVHGILRRSSSFNTGRIEHLYLDEWVRDMKKDRLVNLHYGDMTDSSSLIRIIQQVQPDEIYNLAAQSHVKVSFDVPEYTAEADAVGTLRMLEAVRILGMEKKTRIYQACKDSGLCCTCFSEVISGSGFCLIPSFCKFSIFVIVIPASIFPDKTGLCGGSIDGYFRTMNDSSG